MITVSRKEIEALQRWQDDEEIANNCYEDDDGCFILYDDLRALLDKAEVVSGEAVGEIKIYWGSDTGYEYGLTLIGGALGSQKEYDEWIVKNFNGEGIFKLYTSPRDQSAKIAELTAKNTELEEYIEIDCRQVIQNFQESDIKLTAKCEKMREALQETVKLIDKREIDYILTADDAILRETCNKLLEGV